MLILLCLNCCTSKIGNNKNNVGRAIEVEKTYCHDKSSNCDDWNNTRALTINLMDGFDGLTKVFVDNEIVFNDKAITNMSLSFAESVGPISVDKESLNLKVINSRGEGFSVEITSDYNYINVYFLGYDKSLKAVIKHSNHKTIGY